MASMYVYVDSDDKSLTIVMVLYYTTKLLTVALAYKECHCYYY